MDTHQEDRVQLQDIEWDMERFILALKGGNKTNLLVRKQIEVKVIMKTRNK